MAAVSGAATDHTRAANAAVLADLPFEDRQDYEDAQRGFIATVSSFEDNNAAGLPIWNLARFGFLDVDAAPETVNPSLWRIAQLNRYNGLFEVVPRVYQIRGFDLSNMTIVEGDTGVIVIDPLISPETSALGLRLYRENRGERPVVAVVYTHSHIDHYGGVKGVTTVEDVASGKVQIIAPDGFLEEAVSENVYAGGAMARRALFQYGPLLPAGPTGGIDAGLGKSISLGVSTIIPPTLLVTETGESHTVDGVELEFFMAPNTEAPSEFLVWFPQFSVLDAAEDVTHTLHNLYTLRGAQVRDSRTWWKVINGLIERYGDRVEAIIAQHHWPVWGNGRIVEMLENERDLYKYLHDQVLHLANSGLTMVEIAEAIRIPDTLGKKWYNRGYYGSVNHDAKAVYQRYLGWYDSNPANLWPLPPEESATRYVEYMGGADAVIAKAHESFEAGDYRWVAEVLNRVVFADPGNTEARELEAEALEQLGFQSENPTWRNEFLYGAHELRNGAPKLSFGTVASPDVIAAMTPEMLLDYLGIRLDGPHAADYRHTIEWRLPETGGSYLLELRNGVLIYTTDKAADADAVLTASKETISAVITGLRTYSDVADSHDFTITGDADAVAALFGLLTTFEEMFHVVEP